MWHMSRKQHFLASFPIFLLLHSFQTLLSDVSWALLNSYGSLQNHYFNKKPAAYDWEQQNAVDKTIDVDIWEVVWQHDHLAKVPFLGAMTSIINLTTLAVPGMNTFFVVQVSNAMKRVVVNSTNSLVTLTPMCIICLPIQYCSMQSSTLDKINGILSLRTAFIITSATWKLVNRKRVSLSVQVLLLSLLNF